MIEDSNPQALFDASQDPGTGNGAPKRLTVLICTHNRQDLLQEVLQSLNAAERPTANWQVDILVVANACVDATGRVLDAYRSRQQADGLLPLTWFAEPTPGKSHALNSALERVDADLVFLEDDDQRVAPDFLAAVCAAADRDPDIGIFCGRLLPDWTGAEPAWIRLPGPYRVSPSPIPDFDPGTTRFELGDGDVLPSGGNLILRGVVLRQVGQFSTELGPRGHNLAGGEDTAYIRKAMALGVRLMFDPAILQYHYVDQSRLRFSYLVRLAYKRTFAVVRMEPSLERFPLFVLRKMFTHVLTSAFALSMDRRRYFAIRAAATFGEALGFAERRFRRLSHHRALEANSNLATFGPAVVLALMTIGAIAGDHGDAVMQSALIGIAAAAVLVLRSVTHFTQTGPQLLEEIQNHYLGYAASSLARLSAYVFVISTTLAMGGATTAIGFGVLVGASESSPWRLSLAGIGFAALVVVAQFCRHLLYVPASIEASSNYRTSRLYGLWACLSPRVVALLGACAPTLLAVAAGAGTVRLLLQGAWVDALALLSLAFGSLLALALGRGDVEPKPAIGAPRFAPEARKNVLMIGSDSLRLDSLGRGLPGSLTPNLDALAARGALFSECIVPCARTAPSLMSLLSSKLPVDHGVRDNFTPATDASIGERPLPRALRELGYRTVAISDWCGADLGKFDFGFEELDVPEDQWNIRFLMRQGPKDIRLFLSLFTRGPLGRRWLPEIHYLAGCPMTAILGCRTRQALRYFAEAPHQPFFVNVFMSSTHAPFGSEYPYYVQCSSREYAGQSKFVMHGLSEPFEVVFRQGLDKSAFEYDQIKNLYAGCVASFDAEVGKIMNFLNATGLAETTIVIVYSDHGMEFFERETWGQGNSVVVDESARVPLIVVTPGAGDACTVGRVAGLTDVAPTVFSLLGHEPPVDWHGRPLLDAQGRPVTYAAGEAYSETGIWVTRLPGQHPDHLSYPDLPLLLEVPDKQAGTIAVRQEYRDRVIQAKDRMLKTDDWKIVRMPLNDGSQYQLFDLQRDPACLHDVAHLHADVLADMRARLDAIVAREGRQTARAQVPASTALG